MAEFLWCWFATLTSFSLCSSWSVLARYFSFFWPTRDRENCLFDKSQLRHSVMISMWDDEVWQMIWFCTVKTYGTEVLLLGGVNQMPYVRVSCSLCETWQLHSKCATTFSNIPCCLQPCRSRIQDYWQEKRKWRWTVVSSIILKLYIYIYSIYMHTHVGTHIYINIYVHRLHLTVRTSLIVKHEKKAWL